MYLQGETQLLGKLESMQVGTPHPYGTAGATARDNRPWQTSFFRYPSSRSRKLFFTHLEGNAQADTKNHGTLNQAVLFYALKHYEVWQQLLQKPEMGPGGFGENFTVSNMDEETVCLGDTYAIGEALIQVTGPRYPCWKIERRWGLPGLTAQVAQSGRTGWYCSVLQEGIIEPGVAIELVARTYPEWSMALINDFGHGRNKDRKQAEELVRCPLLGDTFWSDLIFKHLEA